MKQSSKIAGVFTAGVVFMPIINQYKISSLAIIDLFLLMSAVLLLMNGMIYVQKSVFPYMMYTILVTVLMCSQYSISMPSLVLKIFRFALIVYVIYSAGPEIFDFELGIKIYSIIVYSVATLVFIQYTLYLFAGIQTCFLIPDVVLNYNNGLMSDSIITKMAHAAFYRPSSVFIEPAHQAEFMLPWIGFSLFKEDDNSEIRRLLVVLYVSIGLLLGSSFTSIVCCGVIWALYCVKLFTKIGFNAKYLGILLIAIVLIIITVNIIRKVPSIQQQITRKWESANNTDAESSFTMRVMRGWYCFNGMDLFHKIFGCGYGSYEYYYKAAGLSTIYDNNLLHVAYMSGWFSALCNLGFVGLAMNLYYVISAIRRCSKSAVKMMYGVMALLMFGSELFDRPVYLMVILFVFAVDI